MSTNFQKDSTDLPENLKKSFEQLKTVDVNSSTIDIHGSAIQTNGQSVASDLLIEKVKHFQAEISVVKDSPISVEPCSKEFQYDSVKNELEKSISELNDTLKFINAEARELETEIIDEEKLEEQLGDIIVDSLKKRLAEQKFEKDDIQGAKEKLNDEIEEKRIKANAYFKQLLRDSHNFFNRYFKLPSQEEFSEVQKKLRSADKTVTIRSMLSLKDIVSELMNKCFDEPNQPYIVIDKRYWPPYIELLLRCQIVLRHPDDPRRIKLIPFHL